MPINRESKSKARVVIIIAIILIIIITVGVATILWNNPPSEQWFIENTPEEFLKYAYKSEDFSVGTIRQLKVVNESSELGFPTFSCDVIVDAGDFDIHQHLKYICEHSLSNWTIKNIEYFAESQCVGKDDWCEEKAQEYLKSKGITDLGTPSYETHENTKTVIYNVSQDSELVKIEGTIKVDVKFTMSDMTNSGELGFHRIKHSLSTYGECENHWKKKKIIGEWLGQDPEEEEENHLYFLKITKGSKNTLKWKLTTSLNSSKLYAPWAINDKVDTGKIKLKSDYESILELGKYDDVYGLRADLKSKFIVISPDSIKLMTTFNSDGSRTPKIITEFESQGIDW